MPPLILEANRTEKAYWTDLFRHRELFYFFALRDVLVRYKQAALGIAWALFRPLVTMALFTFLFGQVAHFSSMGIPYPLFVLAGMIPWMFFSAVMTETCTSLLNNPALLTRVYFPRMIIPASSILVQFVDFIITFGLLFILVPFLGEISFSTLPFLLFYTLLLFLLCLGSGLFLSAVTLKWRDVRYIVPFFSQFGLYLSPVAYGSFIVPERLHWLYFMNPMAGIIEGYRYALFGVYPDYLLQATLYSVVISFVILYIGMKSFRKMERDFGDMV